MHTFVICAYRESPYLSACIRSLLGQTVHSFICIATSTPNSYITALANKYHIPVFVREEKEEDGGYSGISLDWDFAYHLAKTPLVTIAHQDDIYEKRYVESLLLEKRKYPDMCLFTCASITIKHGKLSRNGIIEYIKVLLRMPLRLKKYAHLSAFKRLSIRFGNPIICPSCAYDKELLGEDILRSPYHFVLDWDILYRIADNGYRWICIEKPLIFYRVHEGATTKESIKNQTREREEYAMFEKLLGRNIADWIFGIYKLSYRAYQ